MLRRYAKRLLSPFIGLLQVVEAAKARALSMDGKNWAIQYPLGGTSGSAAAAAGQERDFSLIATVEAGTVSRRGLHRFLDPEAVECAVSTLVDTVTQARPPFAAADRYEYWLLDEADDTPLALLRSCVHEEEVARTPSEPAWIAMPAGQLEVADPEGAGTHYVPPVNYRLERLVDARAGPKPRAAWFDRSESTAAPFPPCLIKEDWDREEQQILCNRYIDRLAPRLLMLQDLPDPVRRRLERAARAHVFDVERFSPLYPEVADEQLIAAARVEARLRRSAETVT